MLQRYGYIPCAVQAPSSNFPSIFYFLDLTCGFSARTFFNYHLNQVPHLNRLLGAPLFFLWHDSTRVRAPPFKVSFTSFPCLVISSHIENTPLPFHTGIPQTSYRQSLSVIGSPRPDHEPRVTALHRNTQLPRARPDATPQHIFSTLFCNSHRSPTVYLYSPPTPELSSYSNNNEHSIAHQETRSRCT